MKIIICEEDYSYIEIIHSTLLKYAKTKGIHAEFNLTTRKPASIINFLKTEKAECYFISLDLKETMPAMELIKEIRQKNPNAIINVLSTDASKLQSLDLNTYDVFHKIEKSTRGVMKEELKTALLAVFNKLKAVNFYI